MRPSQIRLVTSTPKAGPVCFQISPQRRRRPQLQGQMGCLDGKGNIRQGQQGTSDPRPHGGVIFGASAAFESLWRFDRPSSWRFEDDSKCQRMGGQACLVLSFGKEIRPPSHQYTNRVRPEQRNVQQLDNSFDLHRHSLFTDHDVCGLNKAVKTDQWHISQHKAPNT